MLRIGGDLRLLTGKRCDDGRDVVPCSLRTPPSPLIKASDVAVKSATNMNNRIAAIVKSESAEKRA